MSGPVERLYFEKEDISEIVRKISLTRHVERYTMLRQWCHGVVVDCACGCGYGTHLISENPDVNSVMGVDISEDAINWANDNFKNDNVAFQLGKFQDLPKILDGLTPDVLVSIETMEHIKDTKSYIETVSKINADLVLVSFPNKKSTHFNKFHYHDFKDDDVVKLFNGIGYSVELKLNLHQELTFLKMRNNKLI